MRHRARSSPASTHPIHQHEVTCPFPQLFFFRGIKFELLHLSSKDVLPPPSIWMDSWVAMRSVMKVKTFQIIVLQGIIGSLPWTAIVFFTMWFELIGFDNRSSAALNSLFAIGCASGAFLGGGYGPLSRTTRPQASCAPSSAPSWASRSWILLTVIPQSTDYWWSSQAPHHDSRLDRAFEGSFACTLLLLAWSLRRYMATTPRCEHRQWIGGRSLCAVKGSAHHDDCSFWYLCPVLQPLYLVFKRDRDSAKVASFKDQELT
ncbi:hypothetical protein ZWY2020_029480 [Hordeum vulgare]|nr:hypothetical protein ZWY2020_029480 [Hordeum vulgare]